jgi:hypothetical protein
MAGKVPPMLHSSFEPSANVVRLTFSGSLTMDDVEAIDPLIGSVMVEHSSAKQGVRILYDMTAVESLSVPSSRFAQRAQQVPVGKLMRVVVAPPWANSENFGSSYRASQSVYAHAQPIIVPTLLQGYQLLSLRAPRFQPLNKESSLVERAASDTDYPAPVENKAPSKPRKATRDGEGQESPGELRSLARRVRVIASGMKQAERQRLLVYADELEVLANRLEGDS